MKRNDETKTAKILVPPELIARAKAGEQAAYTELYETTSPALYRSVRSMVHDEDLAWDIVQESYIRAFRSLDKLGANEAFLPWLRRIAVNETARSMAERRPLRFSELEDEDGELPELPELPDLRAGSQPELILDRQETSRLVREILADLPEQQNVIVGMRYYEDLSVREISELLKLAPGTVKAQLHRGRKHVEDRVRALEKQGVKLYGLSPMAFLVSLLRRLEPAAGAERTVLGTVLVNTPPAGASVGAAAGTGVGAASGAVTTVTAMTTGQAILHGLGAKIAAGVLCAALIGGGIWAGGRALGNQNRGAGDWRPTETRMAVPVETEAPVVTEPAVPEPTEAPLPEKLSGRCGDDLTWRFDPETETLSFDGSGEMDDYGEEHGVYPEWYAFASRIRAVELPEGLTRIGGGAFYGCNALTEVTIPDSVMDGADAFIACSSLTEFHVGAGNPMYCTLDGVLFDKDRRSLIVYPAGKRDASYEIPEGVRNLGYNAFDGCEYLTEVTLPDSLSLNENYITWPPFLECPSLTAIHVSSGNSCVSSLDGVLFTKDRTILLEYPSGKKEASYEIPEGVKSLEDGAFWKCAFLTELTVPDSVTDIDLCAFTDCTALTDIQVSPGNSNFSSLDGVLFDKDRTRLIMYPCGKKDASYGIPAGVESIDYHAFADCDFLTEVTIPDSVTDIGVDAFILCTGLARVNFGNGVTNLRAEAFFRCTALKNVTIPDSVKSIEYGALGMEAFVGEYKKLADFTIYGQPGSEAQRYAEENGFAFVRIS